MFSTLGLTVGYVKAYSEDKPGMSWCHPATGWWWHLLLASTDNDNIPTAMSSRGVQQDFRIDFYKHGSLLWDLLSSKLGILNTLHSPIYSAKVLVLHSAVWNLSWENG